MELNIETVVSLLGIKRLNEGNGISFNIVCPYCGDSRGKANVRITRNGMPADIFHCFACGKGGNMLDLYLDLRKNYTGSDRYKRAYEDLLELTSNCEDLPRKIVGRSADKAANKAAPKAPDEILDQTYRTMFSMLPLQKEDREDLARRGLSDRQIEEGYFATVPTDGVGICKRLIRKGCILKGVPGFFSDKNGEWKLNVYQAVSGYFCPVISNGRIIGSQIRLRHPKNGNKYVWLTSAEKNNGVSSGTPICSYRGTGYPADSTVVVTEGILKAYVAYCIWGEKISVIGVPGIMVQNGLSGYLKPYDGVIEAFDMEKKIDPACRCDYKSETCSRCRKKEYYVSGCCQKKKRKREDLDRAIQKLKKNAEDHPFASYEWDLNNQGLWTGRIKGVDDYLLERRKCFARTRST